MSPSGPLFISLNILKLWDIHIMQMAIYLCINQYIANWTHHLFIMSLLLVLTVLVTTT